MKIIALVSTLFVALPVVSGGTMKIHPSVAIRATAVQAVDETVRPYVADELPFVLDGSAATIEAGDRSIRRWYDIDWASAFSEPGKGKKLTVVSVTPRAHVLDQEGYYTPIFSITIRVRTDAGLVLAGAGQAKGPEFKGGWSFSKDAAAIHSSNVAFYAAFLDALGRIAGQIQPPSAHAVNGP